MEKNQMTKQISKAAYRQAIMEKRRALDCSAQKKMDVAIQEALYKQEAFQLAPTIFSYFGVKQEVGTAAIILKALAMKKRVALPKCRQGQMYFVEIQDVEHLVPTSFGLLEPKDDFRITPDSSDLLLMPGVAFDKKGHRIGYGGRYYDQYIPQFPSIRRIAIAYDFQVFDEIPFEAHDIKPHMLITEKNIYLNS